MPLIGPVPARGRTPAGLAAEIAAKLRRGFIRDPSVAVEIEAYRPFFILGEVAAPGQYPYVPNMTVESAVAIAGGFSPRARRDSVTLTHTDESGTGRFVVRPARPSAPATPCSSANAGSDHAFGRRSAASYPARDARPGWRHLPPYPGSRQRSGRPWPSRRHHRRQPHRRRTRRAGAGGDRAAPQARRSSRRDPPRTVAHGRAGMGAFPAPGPPVETRRAARTRRQGRRFHPGENHLQ